MQPIDLNPHDLEIVLAILQKFVPDLEVWAFGSRVKWTAKPFSDLDLVIVGKQPLPISIAADLAEVLADHGPSQSGKNLPRIGRIEGRVQSLIRTMRDGWLPGTFFAHFFKDFDQIVRHYQVIQTEAGSVRILIVPDDHFSDESKTAIETGLRPFLGEGMRMTIELVETIPLLATGKRPAVIGKLAPNMQSADFDETIPLSDAIGANSAKRP